MNSIKCPKCGSTNVDNHAMLTCNPPIPQYECKDCGHLFTLPREDPNKETMPTLTIPNKELVIKYGWVCPRCGKVNSPFTKQCNCGPEKRGNYYLDRSYHPTTTTPPSRNFNLTADACKYCSNNPANGGSGFCNCILGIMNEAICSVTETEN